MPIGSPARCSAQVVVTTAGACRLGDDLELADGAAQLEQRLVADRRLVEDELLLVCSLGADVLECQSEPAQVLAAEGGHDVEAMSDLLGALDHAGERTHDDVGNAAALEGRQDRVGVRARCRNAGRMALIIKADVQTEAALVDILDSFCSSFEARDAAARSTVPARGGWLVAQADGAVVGPARL